MALDVDHLRAGLDDYRQNLERQRERLRDDFAELEGLFGALWVTYGGQMSEDLRHRWSLTAQWFEQYLHDTGRLDQFLEARTEELRHL